MTLRLLYTFFALGPIRSKVNTAVARIFQKTSSLQKTLLTEGYDIVLCPCSAAGTAEMDIGTLSLKPSRKLTSFLLIDNWDNLSSKYVMAFKPDHTLVWGEQSRIHGMTIQRIPPNQITSVGTARFQALFNRPQLKSTTDRLKLPKRYILFCGSQTYFDETSVLIKIRTFLTREYPNIDLVYRPHPWRETLGKDLEIPDGIIVDPTLEINAEKDGSISLPSQEYATHSIAKSMLVIGGCTSMLIEVALLNKPYLLLAHDDQNPIQSPMEYFLSNHHQNLTSGLKNVRVCFYMEDLTPIITALLKQKSYSKDDILDHIISPKTKNFSEHLSETIISEHLKLTT
jgi:hypothetical protein